MKAKGAEVIEVELLKKFNDFDETEYVVLLL